MDHFGISATISTHQEIQCLPYAGFFLVLQSSDHISSLNVPFFTIPVLVFFTMFQVRRPFILYIWDKCKANLWVSKSAVQFSPSQPRPLSLASLVLNLFDPPNRLCFDRRPAVSHLSQDQSHRFTE